MLRELQLTGGEKFDASNFSRWNRGHDLMLLNHFLTALDLGATAGGAKTLRGIHGSGGELVGSGFAVALFEHRDDIGDAYLGRLADVEPADLRRKILSRL